jgi:hypothetical protein
VTGSHILISERLRRAADRKAYWPYVNPAAAAMTAEPAELFRVFGFFLLPEERSLTAASPDAESTAAAALVH